MPTPPGSTDGSDGEPIEQPDADRSHALIESGCLREFAVHVLHRPTTGTSTEGIDIRPVMLDSRQAAEIACQLPDYDQLAAVVGKHADAPLSPPHCTLAATVDVGPYTWELLAFELTYPRMRTVYSVVGRRIDRSTESVVTVIDPRPHAMAPSTAIIFEITAERVTPIPITLDERLPSPDPDLERRSMTDVGYHVAIDWFVS